MELLGKDLLEAIYKYNQYLESQKSVNIPAVNQIKKNDIDLDVHNFINVLEKFEPKENYCKRRLKTAAGGGQKVRHLG
jgi:hypothetical protein